jgi:glycosyltransferase involved in cell wall biosynthesis
MSPLISVCIPTFNGEKYIRSCLDSCLAQSFKDFELVICDDGSSDLTVELIKTCQEKMPSIRFFENPTNLGLVGNWNKCLELAEGTWIKFLFQDDQMAPDCLSKFQQQITSDNNLIVCKRNFVFDKKTSSDELDYYTRRVRTLENTGAYHSTIFSAQTISKLAGENIALNFIAEPSLTFFRKAVVAQIGMFDPELKQICDLEFFLRIAVNHGLTYIPEQLCVFTIHAESTTEKNIHSTSYHQTYLESLIFAAKLLSKPEFKKLRRAVSTFIILKIKLYVKYKSYLAFKAIANKKDQTLYEDLKKKYTGLFSNKFDSFYLEVLRRTKS